jgi:BirA family biotin operon repressor/biotin-[acetyl-CoA-carboxylase] ligase
MDRPSAWLKWGGVLVETGMGPEGRRAVVGIGLNAGRAPQPSAGLEFPFTTLSDVVGRAIPPDNLMQEFLDVFADLYRGDPEERWQVVLDEWRARDVLEGESIVAMTPGGRVVGVAHGIDRRGALAVDTPGGRRWIEAGDVHLLGQEPG